jgi:transcriptional regulator with XRE-family HTH domain
LLRPLLVLATINENQRKNSRIFDKKGLEPKKLAQETGLSQVHISRILTEKTTNITRETIEKIAKAFNVSTAELTGDILPELSPIYVISYADAGKDAVNAHLTMVTTRYGVLYPWVWYPSINIPIF